MKKIFSCLVIGFCLLAGVITGCGQKGPLVPPPSTEGSLGLINNLEQIKSLELING